MQLGTPAGGMDFDGRGTPVIRSKPMDNYMQSKVGGAWMASEFAKRLGGDGIVSVVSQYARRTSFFLRQWLNGD